MGLMFMYDLYQSKHEQSDFDMFTLDDIDNAFDKVTQLKYSQHFLLTGTRATRLYDTCNY